MHPSSRARTSVHCRRRGEGRYKAPTPSRATSSFAICTSPPGYRPGCIVVRYRPPDRRDTACSSNRGHARQSAAGLAAAGARMAPRAYPRTADTAQTRAVRRYTYSIRAPLLRDTGMQRHFASKWASAVEFSWTLRHPTPQGRSNRREFAPARFDSAT
jgi:hypothetical protein